MIILRNKIFSRKHMKTDYTVLSPEAAGYAKQRRRSGAVRSEIKSIDKRTAGVIDALGNIPGQTKSSVKKKQKEISTSGNYEKLKTLLN